MTQKHTPGPWIYDSGAVYSTASSGRLLLADRENPRTSPTERDRNVQLAAAAPDMLAALDAVGGFLDWTADHGADAAAIRGIQEMRRAAIARATQE